MNGFIDLIKPPGMTSSDAVMAVRRLLPRKTPVGHGGTLDPDAAGVLPICVGKATRLFDYIIDKDKTYIGELLLGVETDTLDASGKILARHDVNVSMDAVFSVLNEFTGAIEQVPPVYSALKLGGEPMYRLARKGESIALEARRVHVHSIELLCQTAPDRFLLKIICGKGVYIRSLMRDIGARLGSGGCMSFLLRSQSGALTAGDGYTLDELSAMEDISHALQPCDAMLGAYPKAVLPEEKRANLLNGQMLMKDWFTQNEAAPGEIARVYVENEFAGMGVMNDDGSLKIKAMLLDR